MLADEISPDTCRLWDEVTHEKLDKDRFRRDMGGVEDAYQEVMRRLMGDKLIPQNASTLWRLQPDALRQAEQKPFRRTRRRNGCTPLFSALLRGRNSARPFVLIEIFEEGIPLHKNSKSDSYAAAGVDVTAGYQVVDKIKPLVKSTYIDGVLGGIGDFGGQFAPNLTGMTRPILVSGTDGVGTKLKIAFLLDKHDTVGIDCVAMCVNDIICCGAKPLFFLDYIACGKNIPSRIEQIVTGIADGCRQSKLRPHRRRDRRNARLLPRGRVRPGRVHRGYRG